MSAEMAYLAAERERLTAAINRVQALADAWERCGMEGGHPSPQYMAGLVRAALAGEVPHV